MDDFDQNVFIVGLNRQTWEDLEEIIASGILKALGERDKIEQEKRIEKLKAQIDMQGAFFNDRAAQYTTCIESA